MHPVNGVVQHYDWGDQEFIPRLFGRSPDGRPWAELWLGTHPNGPTHLGDGRPLSDVTGSLPYLLKVLAAARAAVAADPPERRSGEGRDSTSASTRIRTRSPSCSAR